MFERIYVSISNFNTFYIYQYNLFYNKQQIYFKKSWDFSKYWAAPQFIVAVCANPYVYEFLMGMWE